MEYVFFAGANGSGKSTLIKNLRSLDEYQGFRYICADEIETKPELANLDKNERMKMANFLAKAARWGLSEERRSALPCALEATNKKRKRRDAKKGDVPKKS